MYLNIFKYYYRNKIICKKNISLVYKMAVGLLKKKKQDTPV